MNEWRITKTTIDAEMLRLAALLCVPVQTTIVHAGLGHCQARAANAALKGAVLTFAGKI
jgi:hypothetical protein